MISRLRNILSKMSPSDISSYLFTNILTIGISSVTPMMYLSMDTIKCLNNADQSNTIMSQCSAMYFPQASICLFLLVMMMIKVIVAPLSTTTLTTNDLIKLNLPRRLVFQGILLGIYFVLNLFLFANMEDGRASKTTWYTFATALTLAIAPLAIEAFHMVFHHAHRTSLAPPPQRSLTSPPSYEISLSPPLTASPATQGGVTEGFV